MIKDTLDLAKIYIDTRNLLDTRVSEIECENTKTGFKTIFDVESQQLSNQLDSLAVQLAEAVVRQNENAIEWLKHHGYPTEFSDKNVTLIMNEVALKAEQEQFRKVLEWTVQHGFVKGDVKNLDELLQSLTSQLKCSEPSSIFHKEQGD